MIQLNNIDRPLHYHIHFIIAIKFKNNNRQKRKTRSSYQFPKMMNNNEIEKEMLFSFPKKSKITFFQVY